MLFFLFIFFRLVERVDKKGKKKRKRRSIVESNWREYYGSNKHLVEELETSGDIFYREILHLCKTKGEELNQIYHTSIEKIDNKEIVVGRTIFFKW